MTRADRRTRRALKRIVMMRQRQPWNTRRVRFWLLFCLMLFLAHYGCTGKLLGASGHSSRVSFAKLPATAKLPTGAYKLRSLRPKSGSVPKIPKTVFPKSKAGKSRNSFTCEQIPACILFAQPEPDVTNYQELENQ